VARRSHSIALLCSSRCPGTVIVHGLDVAIALKDAPIAIVSGFQSPLEKESLTFLLKGSARLVVCPARSALGMRIPAAWKGPIAEGRLSIRSFVDEAAAANGTGTAHAPRRPTVGLAEQRNRFVASISDAVLILHASAGGKLERLAHDLLCTDKPVWTLDDPAHATLIAKGARPVRPDGVAVIWVGA
jgi:hypothetical protein